MYSINKKAALITVIAIGGIGFVAAERTLQQSGTQQLTTSGPQASAGQQIHGTPGSPNATETIDGRYLPAPDPPFRGQINVNATQSKPYWPPRVAPPKDAPNILLIITDDVGFGA